jgi:hypothetical protein
MAIIVYIVLLTPLIYCYCHLLWQLEMEMMLVLESDLNE